MASPNHESLVLVPIMGDEISPRYDLAAEVWIGHVKKGRILDERSIVLPRPSAEELCRLVLKEKITHVVCGGIEEEFYDYLRWKRVDVADNVVGTLADIRKALSGPGVKPGDILMKRTPERGLTP